MEGRDKLWGKSEKGSVVKLNWEGHRIKMLIGLGFRWEDLSSDTLIDFFYSCDQSLRPVRSKIVKGDRFEKAQEMFP